VIDLRSSTLKHVFLSLLSFLFFLKEFSMKTNQNNKCHYFRSFASRMNAGVLVVGVALAGLGVRPSAGQTIHEERKLLASDGEEADAFGRSCAIDNGIVAVGAYFDDDNGAQSGSAYIFNSFTGAQIAKLLPSDGAADDWFGYSIAIDNGIVAVGAYRDDDDGDFSGSAYIFNASTGAQIAKLLPSDGAADAAFGYSIAIDNGVVAVGASGDNNANGTDAGSAYLFNASTGAQIAKLLPTDGAMHDQFGTSIAIDNGVVAVGSINDSDNGQSAGSAYLFNASTGAQIAKLLPTDGAGEEEFGFSIAIDDGVVVVGAWKDNDNGQSSGSAYIFNASTGAQLFKLLPSDGALGALFGYSVAIDKDVVAVGARYQNYDGNAAGAAYLFDAPSGEQIAKLLPSDGTSFLDRFGESIAMDNGVVTVGVLADDDNVINSGSAYIFNVDSDGDGLPDDWETNGIQYTDANGDEQLYMLPGADPMHKDLYIEVDSMVGRGFDSTARAIVIEAFANAPNELVDNPDGLDGITMHLQIDKQDLVVTPFPNNWVEFDDIKVNQFGTAAEHSNAPLLKAKAKAYRYCIFGDSHGTGSSSGLAELPGNDFMVTLGLWDTPGGTIYQQAGTFMHELGHTLNLGHGGVSDTGVADHDNRKPNYYSVMSYTWQNPRTPYTIYWRLDYSHVALAPLNETGLIEGIGIDGSDPDFADIYTLYGSGDEPPQRRWAKPNGTPVDWNGNGGTDPNPVVVDINYLFQCGGVPCPTPGEVLSGRADWPNLRYKLFSGGSFDDGMHEVTTEDTEMTWEIFEQMAETPPPPSDCAADLNGDSVLDFFDVSAFLNAFSAHDLLADFTGDGLFDFFDVQAFLNAYAAGCP
jgi:FG-GAP repeat